MLEVINCKVLSVVEGREIDPYLLRWVKALGGAYRREFEKRCLGAGSPSLAQWPEKLRKRPMCPLQPGLCRSHKEHVRKSHSGHPLRPSDLSGTGLLVCRSGEPNQERDRDCPTIGHDAAKTSLLTTLEPLGTTKTQSAAPSAS